MSSPAKLPALVLESTDTCVAVLLCTKDGERFLDKQLLSIKNQENCRVGVWVSDDGSSDETLSVLKKHQNVWGGKQFSVVSGPQQGYAANFMSLVCDQSIKADYYAFADQDDIWEPHKLSRAISNLQTVQEGVPALYCSRTQLIDDNGNQTGLSPLVAKRPSFRNALVQSLASGNSMVMNKAARNIFCRTGPLAIPAHDWWAYCLVSGVGGKIIYDLRPSIRYRQHDKNVLGAPPGWCGAPKRVRALLQGRFQTLIGLNIEALKHVSEELEPENRRILDEFSAARQSWLVPRLLGVHRTGVYRQTAIENLGLVLATLVNKI